MKSGFSFSSDFCKKQRFRGFLGVLKVSTPNSKFMDTFFGSFALICNTLHFDFNVFVPYFV